MGEYANDSMVDVVLAATLWYPASVFHVLGGTTRIACDAMFRRGETGVMGLLQCT